MSWKIDNFLIRGKVSVMTLAMIASTTLVMSEAMGAALLTRAYIAEINLKSKMIEGNDMLTALAASADSVQDYYCDCILVNFKGKKPVETGAKFYYMKPSQVRVEVVSKDYRNGSVVVRGNDKIRGVGGGFMKYLKMNLAEDSRMLTLPNGYCVVKTDFPSLYADVKKTIANGSLCRTTQVPTEVNTAQGIQKLYVFEVYDKGAPDEIMRHRILIDPKTKLPIEWGVFIDGKLVTTNYFQNLAVNQGFPAEKFQLQ